MRPDLPISWAGRTSAGTAPTDGVRHLDEDESLVDLRCSLVVVDRGRVLVIHRTRGGRDDWVLPGGRPRPGESLAACATREALEETGLAVNPTRIAFVGEVIDPDQRSRTVEVVFTGALLGAVTATDLGAGEPGTAPEWVDRTRLSQIALKPPIAGYLPAMMHPQRSTAGYLGNLWRPDQRR